MTKKARRVRPTKGLPRTAFKAKALGHRRVKVNYSELSPAEKKQWINLDTDGAVHGDIGRVGPSPVPGNRIVCYFDENTGNYDICHQVPA